MIEDEQALSIEELREAYRSMKTKTLRQEVWEAEVLTDEEGNTQSKGRPCRGGLAAHVDQPNNKRETGNPKGLWDLFFCRPETKLIGDGP